MSSEIKIPKFNSRMLKIAIPIVALAGILGSYVTHGRSSGDPRYREAVVERGDLTASVFSTGVVQPNNRIDVKAPIKGRAEKVLVAEGTKVRRGQILLWMSSAERAAMLDAARARGPQEVARWEEIYRPTPLVAPVDGTIIQRNIESGQSFSDADAIFVMSDRLIVETPVDETDIAQIKKGQKTSLVLDAFPKTPVPSHVGSIAYEARLTNNVTTYIVVIEIEKTPDYVRAGMTANVNFDIASRKGVLMVPAEAVKTRKTESYVMVPPAKGTTPVAKTIQTGISDGRRIEVTEGLNENDIVLIPIPIRQEERSSAFGAFAP